MIVCKFHSGPLKPNAILIGEEGSGAVIDPALGSTDKILQQAAKHNLKIEKILLTHSHWDHVLGFPFFAPIYNNKTHIKIMGCSFSSDSVREIIAKTMQPPRQTPHSAKSPGMFWREIYSTHWTREASRSKLAMEYWRACRMFAF